MENSTWKKTLDKDRVSAVIIKEDKILLIHRFREGKEYWVLPGGGIEKDETKESALEREVLEELSLAVIDKRFLFTVFNVGRNEHHYLITKYSGAVKLGGPEAKRANENNKYLLTWVPMSEFKQLNIFYPPQIKDRLVFMWDNKKI